MKKMSFIFWDWKSQPDFKGINKSMVRYANPSILEINSGTDSFVVAIVERGTTKREAQAEYDKCMDVDD